MGQGHIHDFDPGIAPNGLFWTVRIPDSSVQVDVAKGTAAWRLTEVPLPDELTDLPSIVTMAMAWGGDLTPVTLDDSANGFAGTYTECKGMIEWSARQPGFTFASDPASTTATRFAAIGRERNGVYYNGSASYPNPFDARRLGDNP